MKTLRILFMGTPDFAVPALRMLLDGPDRVVGVICQPDRKKGRGRKLVAPPVKELALAAGIPLSQPKSVRGDDILEWVRGLRPDLTVVAAYGRILPAALIDLPPLGTINVHGSLLPRYRGAAPIQWAVINGDRETGITIMQMDEGMDTGDILLQRTLTIEENETSGSLFVKMARLGADALRDALDLLREDRLTATPQDDSLATEAPMLDKEMGHIDWNRTARELHCLIRGLDPWPSAYGFLDGRRFRFFHPRIQTGLSSSLPPGSIMHAGKEGLLVATADQPLLIGEIQPEGKKRMDVASFLCGHTFGPDSIFS